MFIISHRGNLDGQIYEKENEPSYIDQAIEKVYYVEIDVRYIGKQLLLGHDKGQYLINEDWLMNRKNNLFVHAKDTTTLEYFTKANLPTLEYFYHNIEDCVITSRRQIWCFPDVYLKRGVTVELGKPREIPEVLGICTDYPLLWMEFDKWIT